MAAVKSPGNIVCRCRSEPAEAASAAEAPAGSGGGSGKTLASFVDFRAARSRCARCRDGRGQLFQTRVCILRSSQKFSEAVEGRRRSAAFGPHVHVESMAGFDSNFSRQASSSLGVCLVTENRCSLKNA